MKNFDSWAWALLLATAFAGCSSSGMRFASIECTPEGLGQLTAELHELSSDVSKEVAKHVLSGGDYGSLARSPEKHAPVEQFVGELNRLRACSRKLEQRAPGCGAIPVYDTRAGAFRLRHLAEEHNGTCRLSAQPILEGHGGGIPIRLTSSGAWKLSSDAFPKCQTEEDGVTQRSAVLSADQLDQGTSGIEFQDIPSQPPMGDPNLRWRESQLVAARFHIGAGDSLDGFRNELELKLDGDLAKFIWSNGATLFLDAKDGKVSQSNFLVPSAFDSTCKTAHSTAAQSSRDQHKRFSPDIQADAAFARRVLPGSEPVPVAPAQRPTAKKKSTKGKAVKR